MTRTRVSLVTLGDPNKQTGGYLYHRRLAESAPRHGVEMSFVSFPERRFPLPALFGRAVMARASRADVVVIDSIAAGFTAGWLRVAESPIVGMLHQGPGGIGHGWVRTRLQAWLDRRAYMRMRALLVASESLAGEIRGMHRDIRVVPPGRDTATKVEPEVADLRRGGRVAFLCVSIWTAHKGIIELLDAFATLPETAGTLHLVGDNGVDPRYTAAVGRRLHRLGGRVVVHGVVTKERVAALYRDADVFVMPSYKETYGTVYGEAMAAGLPVVGWKAGNLPYLADHEREGLILEPGNRRALAAALRRLSEDRTLRVAMGDAARARAATLPTWEQTASTFFSELRGLIEVGEASSRAQNADHR
jgi:glycosyltransferase involved in cell wall biosynthesis